jgi:tetratricopeptide (TPR) repeat protein
MQCASAGEPAARARVLTALARALREQGDLPAAGEALRAAAMAAQLAGDDDAAARAGFQLSALIASSGLRLGEARRQSMLATAAMERAGSPPELQALERQARAEVVLSAGRPEKAVQANAEAVAALKARPRPTDALLGQVLTDGGALLERAGHPSEAVAQLREAVSVRSKVFRADHPLVAESLLQLADAEAAQGDLPQARRDQARAVSILERGPPSPRLLRAKTRLAELQGGAGGR